MSHWGTPGRAINPRIAALSNHGYEPVATAKGQRWRSLETNELLTEEDAWERYLPERNALVESNLGIIGKVVCHLPYPWVNAFGGFDDCFQAGTIGLIRAAELWDSRRVQFSTYAYWSVKKYLTEKLPYAWSPRVPRNVFFALWRSEMLPLCYGVGEGDEADMLDGLPEKADMPADGRNEDLHRALGRLKKPDRQLLHDRFWSRREFSEMGDSRGISGESARQKTLTAIRRLRAELELILDLEPAQRPKRRLSRTA